MFWDDVINSKDELFNMIRILVRQRIGLKLVHINAQSLNNKMDEFRRLFVSSGVDIICVSETWFHSDILDDVYNIPGYKLFRADRKGHAGGACIYVRHGITCKIKIKSGYDSPSEYIFLELIMKSSLKILVGCVYRPNKNIDIANLLSDLQNESMPYNDIIVVGDFNCNLLMESFVPDHFRMLDLYPVNTTLPTHFHTTTNSLIDIIFTNQLQKILLYDQLSAPVFSKHDLLFMAYNVEVATFEETITFRDFKRLNYDLLYRQLCTIHWDEIYNKVNVNDQVAFFQDKCNDILNEFVPLRSIVPKNKEKPWFSYKIKQLIHRRDCVYKRWKKYKTPEIHSQFKSLRQEVTKSIQKAKFSYFKNKFSTAVDSRSKWKQIREIGIGQKQQSLKNIDIDVEDLNKKFVCSNSINNNENVYLNLSVARNDNEFSFRCTDRDEILSIFKEIKSNAVGMDCIHPKLLRIILPILLPFITYMFNTILTKSVFPDAWKKAKIVPLPKSNNDFRPISILPLLSKVMENLIYKQINQYLTFNKLLTERQSGFRKNRSCVTALIDVTEELRSNMDNMRDSFLILLDHSKAFDTVNHSILLTKLEKIFNFSSPACRLINSYLSNRTQSVFHCNKFSTPLPINNGVPQGSVLGPLLFCIYINDLPEALEHCQLHIYADDVQLYMGFNSQDCQNSIRRTNYDLNRVNNWASNNKLTINPSKSKCIYISKNKQNIKYLENLKINGSTIDYVSSASNLGVIFNDRLSWSNHVSSAVGKVHGMLRNLWAVQSSTPLEIRMLLAKTYLIPTLFYGLEVFYNCDASDQSKLKIAFNNIARYVFNKGRNDRISAHAFHIFKMRFEDYLKYRSLVFLHKILTNNEPSYLKDRIKFANSNRGKKIIQFKFKTTKSEKQFYIPTIRLWNSLPSYIQIICNNLRFKLELKKFYSVNTP